MKFTDSKSKITGKRIADQTWKVGDWSFKGVNQKNYSGFILSRYHMNNNIKVFAENKLNGLTSILNSHDNVRGIEAGSSVWKSVIHVLPSIAHVCSVWFPITTDSTLISKARFHVELSTRISIRNT